MKVNVSVVEYDENFRALVDFIDNCKPSSFFMSIKEYSESEKRFAALFILASILNIGLEFDYERGEAGKNLKNEFVVVADSGISYEFDLLAFFDYLTKKTKEELFYMRYAERVRVQWLLEDFLDLGIEAIVSSLD
ncbi:hypothetical protein [Pseudomonas moraviensis]|uniref:Uncharacterized protein n=1 Tax=Pseudomonas moraviensis R28-S TaxID=1395516 RepID=V8R4J6_9PSED|nr:hypothetical protein [Pseudomonas moraviensis]ETF06847.1 hypothetical protein PMO01_18535 [Pseudomonas moraviensis R28-S]